MINCTYTQEAGGAKSMDIESKEQGGLAYPESSVPTLWND